MDKVLDTDKLVTSLEVTKRNLFEVDAERLILNKFDGIAVTRDHMYEIIQYSKDKRRKTFDLGKFKPANVTAVASNICGIYLAIRKEVEGDKPYTDYLGIVHHSYFHDGFLLEV